MRVFQSILLVMVLMTVGFSSMACGRRSASDSLSDDDTEQQIDSSLTLEDVTLEQANPDGEIVWKVAAAKAKYSPDSKTAEITQPDGEFFQDGQLIYRVKASTGTVQQDGDLIFLRGDIVATDTRTGAIIKANELEWRPEESLLLARDQLSGTHEKVKVSAKEARVFTREQRMELEGEVKAETTDAEQVKLAADKLNWYMEEDRITSDLPLKFERYDQQKVLVGTAVSQAGEFRVADNTAKLEKAVQIDLTDPPIQIKTNSLLWDVDQESLVSDQPLNIFHQTQNMTVKANQGRMDLAQEIIYLTSQVQVNAQRNQAQLNSDEMTWYIPSEEVKANGNVVYQQVNPVLNLKGPQATGKLSNQTVVIDGGRVVTEIIPPQQ